MKKGLVQTYPLLTKKNNPNLMSINLVETKVNSASKTYTFSSVAKPSHMAAIHNYKMRIILTITIFLSLALNSLAQTITFDTKALIYLNDADMSAFSIVDGKLRKSIDSKDQLSTLTFPLSFDSNDQIKSVAVSSSLLSKAETITMSSDQKLAYVVETRGTTESTTTAIQSIENDFPYGQYVTVVNLKDTKNPKALYRFPVGENPSSISLDHKNQNLIVCSEEYNKELQVFELDQEGKPVRIIKKPTNFTAGRINHAVWHPSGDFIAYINKDAQEVGLLKVLKDGPSQQIIRLEPFGKPIKIEGTPSVGKFTPDQRFFIVLDPKHDCFASPNSKEKGQLFIIKFNIEEDEGESFLISRADLALNPYAFDIHPEGSYIAVCNVESSFQPPTALSNNNGSVTMLRLDFNGSVENLGTTPVDGVFPSSVCFDKTGSNIAVSIFQHLTYGYSFGGIDFFKFTPNNPKPLELQKGKIYLPQGVHSIKAIHNY